MDDASCRFSFLEEARMLVTLFKRSVSSETLEANNCKSIRFIVYPKPSHVYTLIRTECRSKAPAYCMYREKSIWQHVLHTLNDPLLRLSGHGHKFVSEIVGEATPQLMQKFYFSNTETTVHPGAVKRLRRPLRGSRKHIPFRGLGLRHSAGSLRTTLRLTVLCCYISHSRRPRSYRWWRSIAAFYYQRMCIPWFRQ